MPSSQSPSCLTPLADLGPTQALALVREALEQIQSRHVRAPLLSGTVVGHVALLEGSVRAHPNDWGTGATEQALSELLSLVMQLAAREEPTPTQHVWPDRLKALNVGMDGYNAETMAALLVEMGANPWHDVSKEHPVGTSLPLAMGQLQTGLCKRFWAVETGRPTLDALQACRPEGVRQAIRHWLDWASEYPQGVELVRWLLARGVRSGQGNHALAWASSTDTLKAYEEAGDLPSKPSDQKRVVMAWETRLSKGALDTDTVNALKRLFVQSTTFQPMEEDSQALSAIQQALALSSWNQQGVGSLGYVPTLEQMTQRATVTRGIHAGTWSLLVARLMAHIRPCWTHSMGRTDLHRLVDGPVLKEKTVMSPKTLDWHAMAGAMRTARDFDWLPGISINGPLAFMLLAYLDEDDSRGEFPMIGEALGIEQFGDFWKAHAVDAAAFSETMSSRSENAHYRLSSLWMMAMEKWDLLDFKDSDVVALRLMRMFQRYHYHDQDNQNDYSSRGQERPSVSYQLEGKGFQHPGSLFYETLLKTMEHKPLTVDWLVELALWEGAGQGPWALRVQQAAETGMLEKCHLARIKAYVDGTLKKDIREAKSGQNSSAEDRLRKTQAWAEKMSAQVASWSLASRLPDAKASSSGRTRL